MQLTRDAIVGGQFAQAVDGWHRGDVMQHLNAIAAAVEEVQRPTPADGGDDTGARRVTETLLEAAHAEADQTRAQAAEDAERQMAQAQLAVRDLLDRVAHLNVVVEQARRVLEESAAEIGRRLEESSEPLVASVRGRAEALNAEINLMSSGLAANARAAGATGPVAAPGPHAAVPEPEVAPDPAGAGESEPGTGLAPGDLDDADRQLAQEVPAESASRDQVTRDAVPAAGRAGGSHGVERARLIALNMALGGASRDETEQRLREDLEIEDPSEIIEHAFGPAPDSR